MSEITTVQAVESESLEFMGASVEEAVETGLKKLGLSNGEAVVEVLDQGSRGFLGLGSRRARVQVAPRTPLSPIVREFTEELLELMGTPGEVEATQVGRTVMVRIDTGATDGLLIGRKGETLEALQHVILRMAGKRLGDRIGSVRVDISGYRDRREAQLSRLAETLADRVRRSGRRAMTEPLTPAERRVIHRALAEEAGVTTHAGGSGANKRVIITPRRGRGSQATGA